MYKSPGGCVITASRAFPVSDSVFHTGTDGTERHVILPLCLVHVGCGRSDIAAPQRLGDGIQRAAQLGKRQPEKVIDAKKDCNSHPSRGKPLQPNYLLLAGNESGKLLALRP